MEEPSISSHNVLGVVRNVMSLFRIGWKSYNWVILPLRVGHVDGYGGWRVVIGHANV